MESEAGPAANNPGLRAVLRRPAPSATRQRTLEANGIDCGAGPVFWARLKAQNPSHAMPGDDIGPTITATFNDGPLAGRSIEAEVLEGRPPKTLDAPADDGSTCRYCLEGWVQSGRSAVYTFLYRV